MAIQISGTTVIDNSKHLTNISGYSGHRAGHYIRSAGTGLVTDFRISNINIGSARFIISGYSNNVSDQFYGVYDVFGNLNANSTGVYKYIIVSVIDSNLGASVSPGQYNTYFQVRANTMIGNNVQYNYTWDLFYNIGNHTSIPTLTIVNS